MAKKTEVSQPPPQEVQTPQETEQVPDPQDLVQQEIATIQQILSDRMAADKELSQRLRTLSSAYKKVRVELNKKTKKRASSNGNKDYSNSIFKKEVGISSNLATFLNLPKDAKVKRPEITKLISQYIREKNLSDPEDGIKFNPDASLKKVLGEPVHPYSKKDHSLGNGYSYRNLQSYLTPHYVK